MMRVIEVTGDKQLDIIPTARPTYEPFSDGSILSDQCRP
jgi:hypothetical protein